MQGSTKRLRKSTAQIIAFLAVALMPAMTVAQQPDTTLSRFVGTLTVYAEPIMQSGQLQGCSLVFAAMVNDWIYRKGAYLNVQGSAVVQIGQSTMGTMLKVVVNRAEIAPNGSVNLKPSPPSRAYIVSDDFNTNAESLNASIPSEMAGGIVSVFPLNPTASMIVKAAGTGKLTIGFNQQDGKRDIILPVDLRVSDIDEAGNRILRSTAAADLLSCMDALADKNKGGKGSRLGAKQ